MALELGQLAIELRAEIDGLRKDLDKAEGEIKKFGDKGAKQAEASTKRMSLAWKGFAVAAGYAIGRIAADTVKLAVDMGETLSKFDTVFSGSSDSVRKLADNFGILTSVQAKEFLATTGAILSGAGIATDKIDGMATAVGEMARDFASFNNVPIQETFLAINSAITGEREQLKRLGVVLKEAEVQTKALALSGKSAASELTTQDKATATLALITEKAAIQMGDYARTQDSAANRMKNLVTRVGTLQEKFAEGLAPSLAGVIEKISVIDTSEFGDKMKEWGESVGELVTALSELFEALGNVGAGFDSMVKDLTGGDYLVTMKSTVKEIKAIADFINSIFGGRPATGPDLMAQSGISFESNPFARATVPTWQELYGGPTPTGGGGGGGGGTGGSGGKGKKSPASVSMRELGEMTDYVTNQALNLEMAYMDATTFIEPISGMIKDAGKSQEYFNIVAKGGFAAMRQEVSELGVEIGEIRIGQAVFVDEMRKGLDRIVDAAEILGDAFVIVFDITGKIEDKMQALRNLIGKVLEDIARLLIVAGVRAGLAAITGGGFNVAEFSSGITGGITGGFSGGFAIDTVSTTLPAASLNPNGFSSTGSPSAQSLKISVDGETLYTVLKNFEQNRGIA